jgi:hypothetical protein
MRTPTTTFEEWFEKYGQPYESAVIANGGQPWSLDPVKRAATAAQLGLPEDTDPMALRRALWDRRYSSQPLPPTVALANRARRGSLRIHLRKQHTDTCLRTDTDRCMKTTYRC